MVFVGRRMSGPFLILAFSFLILFGCDLFNNLPENNLERKIDEQIAFVMAGPTMLNIDSVPGTVNTITPNSYLAGQKQGYSFTIYFTANPEWAFIEWVAVFTGDVEGYLTALRLDNRQEQLHLSGKTKDLIEINNIGLNSNPSGEAEITVKTGAALTLIPRCIRRPFVTTSNLPGNFLERRVTNYPIQIWFSSEIDDDCLNFDNFIISADTNQGFGRPLDNMERFFNTPVRNGRQVTINRKFTNADSEFGNLNITVSLNLGGIYSIHDDNRVFMGEEGLFRDFYYGVSFRAYTTPPTTAHLEANTGSAGSEIYLFPGDVSFNDEKDRTNKNYYVLAEENGEPVVYLLFDQWAIDNSI